MIFFIKKKDIDMVKKIIEIRKNLKLVLIPSPGYKKNISFSRFYDHWILSKNLHNELLKETQFPDIAFIGYPPIEPAWMASKILKNKNVTIILDVKDLWPWIFSQIAPTILRPLVKLIFYRWFNVAKLLIKNVDILTSTSETYLEWLYKNTDRKRNENDFAFNLAAPVEKIDQERIKNSKKWWIENFFKKK